MIDIVERTQDLAERVAQRQNLPKSSVTATRKNIRDCLFFVADKEMAYTLKGLFEQSNFGYTLSCTPFQFDFKADVLVAVGQRDPGTYVRTGDIIRAKGKGPHTHRHVIVLLDAAWEGAPSAAKIKANIESQLQAIGWGAYESCAIVIEPELENWMWQKSENAAKYLKFTSLADLNNWLQNQNCPMNGAKPMDPKEIFDQALKHQDIPRSATVFEQMMKQLSAKTISRCYDSAFLDFQATLQCWFPGGLSLPGRILEV